MREGLTNAQAALFAAIESIGEAFASQTVRNRADEFLEWLNDADERDGL